MSAPWAESGRRQCPSLLKSSFRLLAWRRAPPFLNAIANELTVHQLLAKQLRILNFRRLVEHRRTNYRSGWGVCWLCLVKAMELIVGSSKQRRTGHRCAGRANMPA